MNKLLFTILLLAPAAYTAAQQPVFQPAGQPPAQPASLPARPDPLLAMQLALEPDLHATAEPDSQPAMPSAQPVRSAAQPVPQLPTQPLPQLNLRAAAPTLQAAQQSALQAAAQPGPQPVPQAAPSSAQPPRAGSDWQMVEALRAGTTLYLNVKGGHKGCTLKSVTEDALICKGTGKDAVYPRAEIWTIKISRRGKSALIGAIPGGVMMAGGGIGLATEKCGNQAILCGLGPSVLIAGGAAVAVVGAGIGALTDFSKSTIYTAP